MSFDIKEKIGPIPAWGWGVVGAGAIGSYIYFKKRAASSTASSTTYPTSTTAIDPLTGLPYGSTSGAPIASGGSGSSGSGMGAANASAIANLATGLQQWGAAIMAAIGGIAAQQAATPATTPTTTATTTTTPGTTQGTPAATGTPGAVNVPAQTPAPTNVASANIFDVWNQPAGQGIPQRGLMPGFNVVRVPEPINTADLQGYNAWSWVGNRWSQFTSGTIPAGVYGVDPVGQNPNTIGAQPQAGVTDFSRIPGVSQPV